MITTSTIGTQVWSIGDDTLDPRQFSEQWFADGYDVVPTFEIGSSDPARDWPRVQPGPLTASTQFREVPVTVVFDLVQAAVAEGGFALELDFYASHGPCPQLQIEVNGHRGHIYPSVVREARADANSRVTPTAGRCHRIVHLPDGMLVEGRNEVRLTTIATVDLDPSELVEERVKLPGMGPWFGSAITWRRLLLLRGTEAPELSVVVEPLPLFVRAECGASDELLELVDITVSSPTQVTGMVQISLNGLTQNVELGGQDREFGDFRARIEVPEWAGTTEAAVTVAIAGRVRSFSRTLRASRKWTVHVLPHVHLDLGYTDAQAKVIELHSRNLDKASDLRGSSPAYRFTVDGSHTLGHFLSTRHESRQDAVLNALRDGRLAVNAFSVLFLSGLASHEELYRATTLAFDLADEDRIAVSHAHLTDVPAYSAALPGVLRTMGLDGFFGIANHIRGGNADSDILHLQSPVRWQGLDGQDVLAFFADCYTQLRFVCADPPTTPGMEDGLTRFLGLYEREDYLPNDLPLVGTHTDNEDLADGYATLVARWAERYEFPKLQYSTFVDYLDAVRPLRDQLPLVTGDGGSYWEDAAGTQAAVIAEYRRAQVELPAADALGALTAVVYPEVRPSRELLDQAWQDLLIGCEHTWTSTHATTRPDSHHSHDQLDWKVSRIHQAWRTGRDEGLQALSRLAELISLRAPALIVFNNSSRSGRLTFEHDVSATTRLLNTDGTEVPFEVVKSLDAGMIRARICIADVPAFGYRVLRIERGGEAGEPTWASGTRVRTDRYEMTLDADRGTVTSLIHRPSGHELLAKGAAWSLGQLLYVTGGGDAKTRGVTGDLTSLHLFDPDLPKPHLEIAPASMRLVGTTAIPGGRRVRLEGSAPTIPTVAVDIRLYDDSDDVEVTVNLTKEHELAKESVYVSFPFHVPEATFRYDRQAGWVNPHREHLPGACNDWFALQGGASMMPADGGPGVIWASADAPLATLEPVGGKWGTTPITADGTILSWIMNNYWWTNTPASQGGDLQLRYRFAPLESWDQAAATRYVQDFRRTPLVDEVTYQDRTQPVSLRLPADNGVLLETEVPPNVDVRVYSSRRHHGLDLRVQEIGGTSTVVRIKHPHGASGTAWRAHPSGRAIAPLVPDSNGWVTVDVDGHRDVTLVLVTERHDVEVIGDGEDGH